MAKHSGRLELTWTDKDKALLSTGDGKYDYTFVDPSDYRVSEVRLLHEVSRHDAEVPEGFEPPFEPTTDNLLITGDAMHALDALRVIPEYADKYLGKIKLCYIDPPFNTGQAFENYEDNIEHSIWLTMLRDRLTQIKPLMSDDGSIWVHLDDTEVHRCRAVLDEVMGADSFIATVVWEKDKGRRNDTDISSAHDYLLIYAPLGKAWKGVRNLLPRDGQEARYKNPDGDPRGPWLQGDNGTAKSGSDKNRFEITLPSGRVVTPGKNYWRFSPEAFEEARADDRVWFGRKGDSLPYIKRYLTEVQDGLVPRTLWTADETGHNQEAKRDHINKMFPDHPTGFATPKPERLLKRIVHIATNPGDIVLDCFAGSGTTAAVAQKMGRRWVASELSAENVETFTKPRLLKVINGEDSRGISSVTERVAATESEELPDGMTPSEAQEFNRLLRKVLKEVEGTDAATIKALRDATKTRDETTVNWAGGGGFTHLQVGESMFEEVGGRVFLADWATNGALTKAMCAQLGIRHRPDGVFAGAKGKVRYVILDGMVTPSTVDAILDQLPENEIVEVWATQVNPSAAEALRKARPGSKLASIPASVLDSYRRKAAKQSPFKPAAKNGEQADA